MHLGSQHVSRSPKAEAGIGPVALIAYDSTMRMAYDGWSRRAWKEEEKKREEAGLSKNRPVSGKIGRKKKIHWRRKGGGARYQGPPPAGAVLCRSL